MEALNNVVLAISDFLYQPFIVPLFLVVGGLYLSFRTKFVQARMIGESFRVISESPTSENGISSFGALMVSTASRVGTGNIIGVSTARVCQVKCVSYLVALRAAVGRSIFMTGGIDPTPRGRVGARRLLVLNYFDLKDFFVFNVGSSSGCGACG